MSPFHIDPVTMRFLERHETLAHAMPGREVLDLGDALVLMDPVDTEPFWNRAVSLRWPAARDAFDHRLTELLALFAARDRRPHVWPSVAWNQPPDLVPRLFDAGFRDAGGGWFMVLADPAASPPVDPGELSPEVTLDAVREPVDALQVGQEAAMILVEAFSADPALGDDIAADVVLALRDPKVTLHLARVDGVPAAVAKATTFDGASYLSSIGTRPRFQGRGLGTMVTRAAVGGSLAAGSHWVYLGVFDLNERAVRLYRKLGFVPIGDVSPDLLLV